MERWKGGRIFIVLRGPRKAIVILSAGEESTFVKQNRTPLPRDPSAAFRVTRGVHGRKEGGLHGKFGAHAVTMGLVARRTRPALPCPAACPSFHARNRWTIPVTDQDPTMFSICSLRSSFVMKPFHFLAMSWFRSRNNVVGYARILYSS